ncbi:pyridoxal phosphate-dependent aminotransferase [Haloplanus pelagicus]|uniref:pyridoxal phosphate-dependent aminotransferase n=1 Tax=Haloplanus pelagicus TaxID=2949995 RepID=UPI00203F1B08|nr:pyridoxal phosphate-dependent aminotransferase [Haloplanus sp. HW8-1]
MTLGPTDRVRSVERSSIRYMFDIAEEVDDDLVRLEVGIPDFDTPTHVTDAACRAARDGHTSYTTNAGNPALRDAIADHMARDYGTRVDPDEVIVTTGGMEALHLAALCTVSAGDEVVFPTPGFPNYWVQARLADGVPAPVPMPAESGFDLNADRLVDAIGPDTALVILCSPNNPTGRTYDPETVRAVVDAAADHDAYVVADEVYLGLSYEDDPRSVAAMTGNPENVLTVNSCSKRYAMTGWRVGWLAGTTDIVDQATKIHESTTSCAPSVSQHAALAALTGPQDAAEEMYDAFRERRDYVVDRVADIDGLACPRPEGAFYAFLDPDLPGTSLEMAEHLLREYGVVLAPGDGFGEAGTGWLRLSFANSLDRLETGFDRLERAIDDAR